MILTEIAVLIKISMLIAKIAMLVAKIIISFSRTRGNI